MFDIYLLYLLYIFYNMEDILILINNGFWTDAYKKLKNNKKLYHSIIDGKTLFHMACIRGNKDTIINYIESNNNNNNNNNIFQEILISDNDNNSGAHLLAINGFDELLCDICYKFPKFLSLKNNDDKFVINYVIDRNDTFLKIYDLMKHNKFIKLFNYVRNDNYNIVMDIIDIIYDDDIDQHYLNILKNKNIDWTLPKENPVFIYIFEKNKINLFCEIIKIPEIDINMTSSLQLTPIIFTTTKNDYNISEMLVKFGANINYGGAENAFLPINISIKNKNLLLTNLFLQTNTIDFNIKDEMLNTPIYYYIDYITTNRSLYENKLKCFEQNDITLFELLEIFVKNTNIFAKNYNNISAFNLLTQFDLYNDIKHLINDNDIDNNNNNNNNDNSDNNNDNSDNNNKIVLPKIVNSSYGLFNPDSIHNIIYMIYIMKKYKNAIFPFQCPIEEKRIWERRYIFTVDPFMKIILDSINLHNNFFYSLLPSIIYWRDKNKYYKTKNIEFYIERALSLNNIRFILLKISLIPQFASLHANIVIFDKKENKLIRFEPYGDWEMMDSYHLDKMILKIFKKIINDKIKYVRPTDYLNNPKFQSASEGDIKKNLGDPIGYCLAWCYWFIELKLKNPDTDEKKLVERALNKILVEKQIACRNDSNCLLGYIRGYGRKLDNEKNFILNKIGIHKNEIYDLSYSSEKLDKIKVYIENYIVKKL